MAPFVLREMATQATSGGCYNFWSEAAWARSQGRTAPLAETPISEFFLLPISPAAERSHFLLSLGYDHILTAALLQTACCPESSWTVVYFPQRLWWPLGPWSGIWSDICKWCLSSNKGYNYSRQRVKKWQVEQGEGKGKWIWKWWRGGHTPEWLQVADEWAPTEGEDGHGPPARPSPFKDTGPVNKHLCI